MVLAYGRLERRVTRRWALGCCPCPPAVLTVDDAPIGFAVQLCCGFLVSLEVVKILEEQHPAGLFDVVQFAAASSVFSKGVVDIFEGGLVHVVFGFLLLAK